MTKTQRSLLFVLAGAIGLLGCDAVAPQESDRPSPAASRAVGEADTLTDVVRDSLVEILRDPDSYSRARRLGTLLPTLGPESVPAVKELLTGRMYDARASELELLLRYWTTFEPEEAARWAMAESPPGYREPAVYAALRTWAEADPRAATDTTWEWALISLTFERIVPIALVRGWYASDQREALPAHMRDLPPGILRQRAIAAYARVVLEEQGADAVMAWAESVGDEPEGYKLAVFRRTVDLLSLLDPEASLRWCDKHCDGPNGKNMRSLISRNWVLVDHRAAFEWLRQLPEGFERDEALDLTYGTLARRDRETALQWMAEQTKDGPQDWLEPMYGVYALFLAPDDPVEAIEWAQRIENQGKRNRILVGAARTWRQLDEAAAEAWLAEAPLPDAAKELAREPIE